MTYKILVDSPMGTQQIIEINRSGEYYEKDRVLWDERHDGPLRIEMANVGGYKRQGSSLVFDQSKKDAHDAVKQLELDKKKEKEDRSNRIRNIDSVQNLNDLIAIVKDISKELKLL